MSVEEIAAIGRRLIDILNERDWDAHFELIAEIEEASTYLWCLAGKW